jgi:transcriptional regulator with XRE-family HTH domain
VNISREKLNELKDRESRQFFYEEHIETGLPIQIRELRKKRKLTQKDLAELAETDQSNVSDWENPNYEYTPNITTLKKLANAFDVPLIVRFGSWKELLVWDSSLSPEKVAPETFDDFVKKLKSPLPSPNESVNNIIEMGRLELGASATSTARINTPEQRMLFFDIPRNLTSERKRALKEKSEQYEGGNTSGTVAAFRPKDNGTGSGSFIFNPKTDERKVA